MDLGGGERAGWTDRPPEPVGHRGLRDRYPKEKSVRRTFLAAAVALLAALSIVSCGGGSASTTLRGGAEGTYSPLSFQGTDGKLTGYDIEVVQAVGAKLGKTVEFVQTPFDSIFAG